MSAEKSADKTESLADVWAARYDDRDAEDLACHRWAAGMALREQAMAQPFKNFVVPDDPDSDPQSREAANHPEPRQAASSKPR